MPDYQYTFTVQNISPQKATVIRDRLTARFDEDDVQVTTSSMGQTTQTYRVLGVDCSIGEPFNETVEAKSKQDAENQIIGTSTTKIIAATREATSTARGAP